ncbi:hypothetical protein PBY51_002744 [Eleginops maclovinus]|uniref:Uncharacterized protein n=1 Tax=Eleginops maclovinus TaxID=56733 RepID=A0AAN7XBY9_ELEMC|nr:hypothetical protein PBY51_002744 [Eleginops maclovinus]
MKITLENVLLYSRIIRFSMKQSKAPRNLQMMNPQMSHILWSSSKRFLRRGRKRNRRIVFTHVCRRHQLQPGSQVALQRRKLFILKSNQEQLLVKMQRNNISNNDI